MSNYCLFLRNSSYLLVASSYYIENYFLKIWLFAVQTIHNSLKYPFITFVSAFIGHGFIDDYPDMLTSSPDILPISKHESPYWHYIKHPVLFFSWKKVVKSKLAYFPSITNGNSNFYFCSIISDSLSEQSISFCSKLNF